jgi:lysophospholipase L1-like esterase
VEKHVLTTKWRLLGAAFLMLATVVVVAPSAAEAAAPSRILLVGDSITEGSGGDTAYRCKLWEALGGAVEFVGTRTDVGDCGTAGFDADHSGQGGITTANWVDMIGPGAFGLSFDAALVHLGTNDVNGVNFDWTQAYVDGLEVEYRQLIAGLRQNNPNVTIYLARIIPCSFGPDGSGFLGCDVTHEGGQDNNGDDVEGINDVWARIAADSTTAASPIILVDHTSGFSLGDLKADGVHPNESGKAKMAAKWAAALDSQLDDEVLLVEPGGRWHIRRPGQADYTFFYGNPGDVPLFGDWDGDGYDTPGMYRPSNGFAYLTNTLPDNGGFGVAEFDFFFGIPGDQVFVGDWDGDGADSLGISRGGKMYLANTNATVVADLEFWFGLPTDIAYGADTDGDGKDSVIVYRQSNSFAYYTNDTNQAVAPTAGELFFGNPGDQFVMGDWDGDGIDTPGIFRGSNSTVYLRNANDTGAADESYSWGGSRQTWRPVAGRWTL